MNGGITALITGISSVVTGIISWFTSKETTKSHMNEVYQTTRGPEWKAFVDEIRAQSEATKKELNSKIDDLQNQLDELRTEVDTLSTKYALAVRHIEQWRCLHPEDTARLAPPTEIKPDIR